jgi:hypothetical protein
VFALNAGQPLDTDALSVYVTLWTEGFADLSDAVLEATFRKTLAMCKFWPVKVADVREHVEQAEGSRAEDEWQNVLEYVRRHVYADLGVRGPKLPADVAHAAAAAGGLYFLESCPVEELQWAKKRFVEDLARQRKAGGIAACLPPSPLGKLLEATAVRLTLPAAPEPVRSVPDNWRPAETSYGLRNAPHPEFAAMLKQGEQRFQNHIDAATAEYRKAHGL